MLKDRTCRSYKERDVSAACALHTCSFSSLRNAAVAAGPRILVGSSGVTRTAPCL